MRSLPANWHLKQSEPPAADTHVRRATLSISIGLNRPSRPRIGAMNQSPASPGPKQRKGLMPLFTDSQLLYARNVDIINPSLRAGARPFSHHADISAVWSFLAKAIADSAPYQLLFRDALSSCS